MPDYKQGKIYSLRSHQTDQVYIGSTIQPLYKRLFQHKSDYGKWMNGKGHYISSFEIAKYDDAYVELVEEYSCDNKMQLDKREGEIIRVTENCTNKRVAGRTQKEYREENKVRIAQQRKGYREVNKDRIAQQMKEYYLKNIETQKRYYRISNHKRNPIGLTTFGI